MASTPKPDYQAIGCISGLQPFYEEHACGKRLVFIDKSEGYAVTADVVKRHSLNTYTIYLYDSLAGKWFENSYSGPKEIEAARIMYRPPYPNIEKVSQEVMERLRVFGFFETINRRLRGETT